MERENEFDLVDEDNETLVQHPYLEDAADVDIIVPFRPGWFDSDSEPESFVYIPSIPVPDTHNGVPLLVDNIIAQRGDQVHSLKRRVEQGGDGNKNKGQNGNIEKQNKDKTETRYGHTDQAERQSAESNGGRRIHSVNDQQDDEATDSQDDANASGSNDHESNSASGKDQDSGSDSDDSYNASASLSQSLEITGNGGGDGRFYRTNAHKGP